MIEIKIDTAALDALFLQLSAKTLNTRPAMADIAEMLFDSVEANFIAGGRPKWKPLSNARIKQREGIHKVHGLKHAPTWPGDILVEWGLQGGLQGKTSSRADNVTAYVGNNAEYAGAMQFGFSGPQSVPSFKRANGSTVKAHTRNMNIPARPFLTIQPEDIKEAEAILLRHLLK